MKKIIWLTLIIITKILINETNQQTKIAQTEAKVLFQPIGQIIPELSWATLRINLNISTMFTETDQLCKTSIMMKDKIKNFFRADKKRKTKTVSQMYTLNSKIMLSMMKGLNRYCQETLLP